MFVHKAENFMNSNVGGKSSRISTADPVELLTSAAKNFTRLPLELLDRLYQNKQEDPPRSELIQSEQTMAGNDATQQPDATQPDASQQFETTPNTHGDTSSTESLLDRLSMLARPAEEVESDQEKLAQVRKGIQAIQSEAAQAQKFMQKSEEARHKEFAKLQETWHPQTTQQRPEPTSKPPKGFGAKRKKSAELPTPETKPSQSKG